ncbi:MAG: hypothetical protein CMM46_15655 [Rhodospirillaceae bacterium]|nr:hypothetical protein [Rhodospirillaceae bacterium]|tara:strand:- start:25248 stop:25607 length:360 start_codon:yes stop_codon:yes gene_type:complete
MVKAVSEYLKGAAEVPHNRTLLFVGAQSPEDGQGQVAGDIGAQAACVWDKVAGALAQKNLEPRHIVSVDIDLVDRADIAVAVKEQERRFRHHVAQTVRITGLADERWRLQVAVVAAVTR